MNPAPFIVGVGRSGTTLLRLMLDAHPQLAIPAETHFLTEFLGFDVSGLTSADVLRLITGAPTWPNLALDETAFAKSLNEIVPFSVPDAIRTLYQRYARRFGKQRWGDKTPGYVEHMPSIAQLLPEAHFIHIVRDGRDVALSFRGLWFGPGDDIEAQATFWVGQIRSAKIAAFGLPHYLEVKYETLITDPVSTLQIICAYLDLPYSAAMLTYHQHAVARLAEFTQPFGPANRTPDDITRFMSIHERTKGPPDPGRVNRWRIEMSADERLRYEAIAGPLLSELGYEGRL